jgi:hypothetical protein
MLDSGMQLSDFVGLEILIRVPQFGGSGPTKVTLVSIDVGGIWIKGQQITNAVLQAIGEKTAPQTPVFFLPYSQLSYAMTSVQEMALDEKAFGV